MNTSPTNSHRVRRRRFSGRQISRLINCQQGFLISNRDFRINHPERDIQCRERERETSLRILETKVD